jgi:Tfp pilus assembly protein PilN
MIKINLANNKKQLDISNVGGFDFTRVKIKALLLVIALIYVPDFVLVPMWEAELETANTELQSRQNDLKKVKSKVNKSKNFETQIKELKAQEENLGKKLLAVKQAISEKKNPSSLLLYVAKNTPENLWLKSLEISENSMLVSGEASDYSSIGNFVTSLRSSVFVKEANITGTKSTVRDSDKSRIETFDVKFIIGRFDQ